MKRWPVEQAVLREQPLGVEAAREPGVVVGALGRAVRRAGDRVDDDTRSRRCRSTPSIGATCASRQSAARPADSHQCTAAIAKPSFTQLAGYQGSRPPTLPRSHAPSARGEQHGDVEAVETAGGQEARARVLDRRLHAGVVPDLAAGRRRPCTGTAARASTATAPGQAIRISRQGIGRLPVQSRHTSVPRAERQSPMKVYGNVLEMIGRTPMLELRQLDTGPCQPLPQARAAESGGLDQGPHRALDDRGSGAPRRPEARRHDHRGDRRQHRARPRARRAAERLPRRAGASGQDEPGEDLQPARHGRGGRAHALRRREGPPGVLPGPRHAPRARARLLPRQPVRQPRQPESAPHHDRPGNPRADGRAPRRHRRRHRLERHHQPGSRSSSASACRPSR